MARKGKGNSRCIGIRLKDDAMFEMFKIVLDYEASRRGTTRNQAFADIVMEAAEIDSYPEQVRARLAEFKSDRRAGAIAYALEASGLGETA